MILRKNSVILAQKRADPEGSALQINFLVEDQRAKRVATAFQSTTFQKAST